MISLPFSDWLLVADKKECDGTEIGHKWATRTVADCAVKCKGTSSMFALGTNDHGLHRCHNDGCTCLCETAAYTDGSCNQKEHLGYRLYKYVNQGNDLMY